jgi:hypothetical protein
MEQERGRQAADEKCDQAVKPGRSKGPWCEGQGGGFSRSHARGDPDPRGRLARTEQENPDWADVTVGQLTAEELETVWELARHRAGFVLDAPQDRREGKDTVPGHTQARQVGRDQSPAPK